MDASVKGLCSEFFMELDRITGDNTFAKFASGGRATTDQMIPQMAMIAQRHGLGLLVIDEIQNLKACGNPAPYLTCPASAVIYKPRAESSQISLQPSNYHRRSVFTEIFSQAQLPRSDSARTALNSYSHTRSFLLRRYRAISVPLR